MCRTSRLDTCCSGRVLGHRRTLTERSFAWGYNIRRSSAISVIINNQFNSNYNRGIASLISIEQIAGKTLRMFSVSRRRQRILLSSNNAFVGPLNGELVENVFGPSRFDSIFMIRWFNTFYIHFLKIVKWIMPYLFWGFAYATILV